MNTKLVTFLAGTLFSICAAAATTVVTTTRPVDPVTGLWNATTGVVTGVGQAATGVVTGVGNAATGVWNDTVHGTTRVLQTDDGTVVKHKSTRVYR